MHLFNLHANIVVRENFRRVVRGEVIIFLFSFEYLMSVDV